MNNPELRAVLTEAQRASILSRAAAALQEAEHQSGGGFLGYRALAEAALDVTLDALASLPGVAVIQLPDEAEIRARHISFGRGADCECCPPWIKDEDIDIEYSVSEAREFAAALLAAAAVVAAGEEA
ncbi:hypothetical protein I5H15_gp075 [Mycobacterium phage Blexus]|uniref:Uncharacterized protein n=1 Tax=Mycobacterium phage Blexus TaxID=2656561 RepID=A0A649VHG0_9CAUD|nr:hypothetical protein I5H15_gp075 [Mycobacterium phage Blexus]ASJ79670.1 hypothetical protein SEA_PIPPY_75 [Mycobacterium phage Pippy]QGJ91796.1 hypothetical protein SEA_BLEXUS_75 [Mycobacterium phage Blexus]UVK58917.1 hypothetical protein SEA_LEOZINHO_78 [Mycobacterium phage Leozinho]WNM74638.1 hypothetical protein SEA_RADIANCE_78 [Mycobacterium Phage Radiance]